MADDRFSAPIDRWIRRDITEAAAAQTDLLHVIADLGDGAPDGFSPDRCRSGRPETLTGGAE